MKKQKKPYILLPVLVMVMIVLFFYNSGNILDSLTSRIFPLEEAQQLQTFKIVPQQTDPFQFDIYYQNLKDNPSDVTLVIRGAQSFQAGQLVRSHSIVESVVVSTGQVELTTASDAQTLRFKNLQPQGHTHLGSIVTTAFLDRYNYQGIAYDYIIDGERKSLYDSFLTTHPSKPLTAFQNPTSELLYVHTGKQHRILAPHQLMLSTEPQPVLAAQILPNHMTTFERLDAIQSGQNSLETLQIDNPKLSVEQGQIVVPDLRDRFLNTLIMRYKTTTSDWKYQFFLLAASKNISSPVPTEDLLDIYSQVEYSFARIDQGFNLRDLESPYTSLLATDEYPVFYQTPFQSLLSDLTQSKNALSFQLQIEVSDEPGILIGLISKESQKDLQQIVKRLEQKQRVFISEASEAEVEVQVSDPQQLPFINLVGGVNQIWSQQINSPEMNFNDSAFRKIQSSIVDGQREAGIEVINQYEGDSLLCLVKTETEARSIPLLSSGLVQPNDCLLAAKRAGVESGEIIPFYYQSSEQKLWSLARIVIQKGISLEKPDVRSFNPDKRELVLNNIITQQQIKIMASADPLFSNWEVVDLIALGTNSFSIPTGINTCTGNCYIKALISSTQNSQEVSLWSETLVLKDHSEPSIDICFLNQGELTELYNPSDLEIYVLGQNQPMSALDYEPTSGCYTVVADGQQVQELSQYLHSSGQQLFGGEVIVLHSNGLSNSHISIPPQRHYLFPVEGTSQQLLLANIIFEHAELSLLGRATNTMVSTSTQLASTSQQITLSNNNKGNTILQKPGAVPYFTQKVTLSPPLNESILYPAGTKSLAKPHTVRLLSPSDILSSPISLNDDSLDLQLDLPAGSSVFVQFQQLFRPGIVADIDSHSGITLRASDKSLSLQNPSGRLEVPVTITSSLPTDSSIYQQTTPPTPIPNDIDIVDIPLKLHFNTTHTGPFPSTSLLNPTELPLAQKGSLYQTTLPLFSVQQLTSFQIIDHEFFTTACDATFQFDTLSRTISADIAADDQLESCLLKVTVNYAKSDFNSFSYEAESTFFYRIPFYTQNTTQGQKKVVVALELDNTNLDQKVRLDQEQIDFLRELNVDLSLKNGDGSFNEELLPGLQMRWSTSNQEFSITGDSSDLKSVIKKYYLGMNAITGATLIYEVDIVPVSSEQIEKEIPENFELTVDIQQVVQELGYSQQEANSAVLLEETLPIGINRHENNTNLIIVSAEANLEGEKFSLLIEKGVQKKLHRIDVELHIITPDQGDDISLNFSSGRQITLDIKALIPSGKNFSLSEYPDWLTQAGSSVLTGTAPEDGGNFNIEVQDLSNQRLINISLSILKKDQGDDSQIGHRNTTFSSAPSDDDCFSDLHGLQEEYKQAICQAADENIINSETSVFNPNNPINRAEVAKVLSTGPAVTYNLLSGGQSQQLNQYFHEQSFSDVPVTAWFFGYTEYVTALQIFQGYQDQTFRPAIALNKAESAKVLVNTIAQLNPEGPLLNLLVGSQLPNDQWYQPYVRVVNQLGGDLPRAEDSRSLTEPISRAQFIYNLMTLLQSGSSQTAP